MCLSQKQSTMKQCRSSWNSCQAWLQLPFVRNVTTRSRGPEVLMMLGPPAFSLCVGHAYYRLGNRLVLRCLCGASGPCCGMMTIYAIAFWTFQLYLKYIFLSLNSFLFFVLFAGLWGEVHFSTVDCARLWFLFPDSFKYNGVSHSSLFHFLVARCLTSHCCARWVLLHLHEENKWPPVCFSTQT